MPTSRFGRPGALLATAAAAAAVLLAPVAPASAAPAHATTAAAQKTSPPARHLLTTEQALAQARKAGKPVQVTGATTASSTLTANPRGTLTLTEQNMPVRRNVNGQWKPLDATLHRAADGSVAPAVTTDPLRLSGGGTGALVSMTYDGKTLALSLPGRLPAPTLSGATATYADVPSPGTDLEVTADDQGGFEETLVVKSAAAARNPALRAFSLRPSVTGGLTLRSDARGTITASRGGHAFFEIPAATMWDSRPAPASVRTAADPAYAGRKVDLRDGQPVTSATSGPGENARTARLRTRLSGGSISYAPDMSVLAGNSTVYPVYIDPHAGSTLTFWAQVDNAWPSQAYPKPNPMQVGYNGWLSPLFTARSFVNEAVPTTLDGGSTDVESATLYLTDTYAPACGTSAGDFGVQVWRTGLATSSTTWNSQPTWAVEDDEKSFSHGYDSSCQSASEGFNVTEAMTQAAHNSWSRVSFGIKADNESDKYGWKHFSDLVTLSTTYDKPPNKPGTLKTSPGTACTASPPDTVGDGDVTLYATVSSPLGSAAGSLTAYVYVKDDATGNAVSGSPFKIINLASGGVAAKRLVEATLKGLAGSSITEFSWYATVSDGTLTSAPSTTCKFNFDPTTPGAPTVCSSAGCDTQPPYTIGTAATFNVTPAASGNIPTGYTWQLNGAAPHTVTASSSGAATISVTPTSGADALTVTAISPGGNPGQPATSIFTASAPANAADGDMTGDGIPDVVTPGGGSTGLAPGLWLAKGEAAAGGAAGDGQTIPSAIDIGAEGNGNADDYSPSDFTGSQVITGLFADNGLQGALAYYPSGTYAGEADILNGNGDGTVLEDKDASNTISVPSARFTNYDAYGDIPLQVANAYNADPNDNAAYPDLITVSGDSSTAGANGYYLEYYQNANEPGDYAASVALTNATPDGNMDWNQWQIATMAEPSGAVDMFLHNSATGALYLWQDFTVDDFNNVAAYTQYELSSSWNPGSLSELRAADITGTGPALWAVTNTGAVTAWTVSGLSGTTGTVTADTAQSLLSPTHEWRLGDGTSSAVTTAADTGSGTALPLTGHGGVAWSNSDLFNPHAQFTASSSGYLETTSQAVNTTGNWSLSAWVKPDSLGGAVLAQYGSANNCLGISILDTTTNGVTKGIWRLSTSESNSSTATSDVATAGPSYYVQTGVWTHLTATYNAANKYLRLYVDGMPAAAVTVTSTWSSGCSTFDVGRWRTATGPGAYFNGSIADVQAWNGTGLNPTEAATMSGTPGYVLFPSNSYQIRSASSSSAWQWTTADGEMRFYQGLITIKETGSGTSTATFGTSGYPNAVLTLQKDGNLVIYDNAADATAASTGALWSTKTSGNPGDVMFFQPDGNLVIYGSYGQTLWASATSNA